MKTGSRVSFFLEPVLHLLNNIWLRSLILSVIENYINITARSSLALSCEQSFSIVWRGSEPLSAPCCCSPLYFDE